MPSLPCRVSLRLVQAALLVVPLLLAGACESTSTPTAPSSGALQVTASASILRAGDTATLAVTSTSTPVPAVTWTSSDASVASVSAVGIVTARRAGTATITAASSAASGQVVLRVVSNFAGTWTGPLLRGQPTCAATSTAPVCVSTTPPSTLLAPVTIVLTQTGATVTGTLTDALEPQVVVPLEGRVDAGDVLALDGRSTLPPLPAPQRRLTVTGLRATIDPTVGTLTGACVMLAERAAAAGTLDPDYSIQAQFRDLSRR